MKLQQTLKRVISVVISIALALGSTLAQADTYFFHNDHLGTPQVLTDKHQAVVWETTNEPFGGATETIKVVEQNLRFPGQYLDRETGLHYNYFRTYDPATGRYFESDPIGLRGGLNTFNYANANPNIYIDNQGLSSATGVILPVTLYACLRNPKACATVAFAICNSLGQCDIPVYQSKAKPDREQRPDNCPSGTKPIDKDRRLDREKIHKIKKDLRAKPKDWVGIDSDGNIWTNEGGEGVNNGHYEDYLP